MSSVRGYITSYPPRLRQYGNALLSPVIVPSQAAPSSRTTKRGTVAVNYAEDGYDDEDIEDGEGPRRPTGLRSLKREELSADKVQQQPEKLGQEIETPVDVQGIFRDWMIKRVLKPSTAQQMYIQAQLPLTLIPIRIDLEIPAYQPQEPLPLPRNHLEAGINPTHPAYRKPDPVPPYRVKDTFLWNLHEALITPDEFATAFVRDLDLPNPQAMMMSVSNQIRQQLEEYAGVALHTLFQNTQTKAPGATGGVNMNRFGSPRDIFLMSAAAATSTPTPNISRKIGVSPAAIEGSREADITLNPDDAYRCIINLNINLQNKLYTDKFEWSLLHPPGMAEEFARVTCADLGLSGEWVAAISHGIYESVLRLKKEACESGGLVSGAGGHGNEIDNHAVNNQEAGWRYDPDGLGDEWEPKVEVLSKEEIERREGDRERQIRRIRRETARFSTTTGIGSDETRPSRGSYFDIPDSSETPMGRGERSKKKRRFRSLSPSNRGGTPGGRGTPETGAGAGYGGVGGALNDWERQTWRCANCMVWGAAAWAVRDGPDGPKTLCHNCGMFYERDKGPPVWSKDLHRHDAPIGR